MTKPTPRKMLVALSLLAMMAAAACGSTSSKSSSGTTTTAASSGGTATTIAASATTAAAASATTSLPTGSLPKSVKATGGGTFCKEVADSYNSAMKTGVGLTPAAIKAELQSATAEMNKAESEAPSAIKGDLKTEFTAVQQFYNAIAAAGYNYLKVPPTAETAMSTPQVKAAEAATTLYVKQKCGITLGLTG